MIANDGDNYGWLSILMHWLTAIVVFGLFGLGLYMVDLDYYDAWYNRAPRLHEGIGLLLGGLLLIRLVARRVNPPPPPLADLKPLERKIAPLVHRLFYLLMFAVVISGYLISSAGGEPVPLFNWFAVPALLPDYPHQEDIAGVWHERLAWGLILLAALHALAAIKHHLIDRDRTLCRIFGIGSTPQPGREEP